MRKNLESFTDKEIEKITDMLSNLEAEAKRPYKRFSGAFAIAEVYNYDDEMIDVELKFGIQNDCDNTEHIEAHRIIRETMEWKN